MVHILLDLNNYIDMWINTRLVHDIYLNSMEVHLSMIDCEKLSCKISVSFSLALINCYKWPLGWGHGCFPVGVLLCENIGLLIFDLVV
jgi:hypothetical protein